MRRYRCRECGHVWRQDAALAAAPWATLSRAGLRWALEEIEVQHLTVARVAEGLDVAWDTANNAVVVEVRRSLIDGPGRFGGGLARLLDMVEGRSRQAFKTWLAERPDAWRDGVEVVAVDGFAGFKPAAAEVPEVGRGDGLVSCGQVWPRMRWIGAGAGSDLRSTATVAAATTRST